jgi:hypothetical protein
MSLPFKLQWQFSLYCRLIELDVLRREKNLDIACSLKKLRFAEVVLCWEVRIC